MFNITNIPSIFSSLGDVTIFLSRIIVAIVMLYFGLPKVRDLKKNGRNFAKMGFNPGMFWGTVVAFVEFLGGIAMFFGVYLWFAAVFFGIEMFVGSIWKIAKLKKPFSDYSYDLLLLMLCLVILSFG